VPSRKIYLLDGGRTAESGTHDELLSLGGAYARLYNEQRELESF
jgi:ATP-binding cassette subfamily B protein